MNLLEKIRNENLDVYRASPQRLQEDVGQEGEIAQNYRGRLIYELIQNADDAISSDLLSSLRIRFVLTNSDLWVANSGRPLDAADVRGLCGISASSKTSVGGKRRASIGHKGMGFKSVLEITESPEVYSSTISFRFSKEDALRALVPLFDEGSLAGRVTRAPVTRFPWSIDEEPEEWHSLRSSGMHTAFRFPLRQTMSDEQRKRLAEALRNLPITSLIFLKHLERIEVDIRGMSSDHFAAWTVERKRADNDGLSGVTALSGSGIFQVVLTPDSGDTETFLLAHDEDIEIGEHRGGLNEYTWEGVEYTEASVAARLNESLPIALKQEWKKFHVFLPTGEVAPYSFLINGAFSSSLSRQEIRVEADDTNYNRYLLGEAARILRDHLIPHLISSGANAVDCLKLMDRGISPGTLCSTPAAQAFYEEVKTALNDFQFLPCESGPLLAINSCAVPPLISDPAVGNGFRLLLPENAVCDSRLFPRADLCGSDIAHILVDHGAYSLTPEEAAGVLAGAEPMRSRLILHATDKLLIDPVLRVLEQLWLGLDTGRRNRLISATRRLPLFPITISDDDTARRISINGLTCFYPPRSLRGEVPLTGLCFLMQELCWGDLTPQERNAELGQQMDVWKALFDIREFKFPEVMRASVLPVLDLDRQTDEMAEQDNANRFRRIAAICQLAGRTPNPNAPLPYERLGSNRALFNLSRMEVPCRGKEQDDVVWIPAYRAYLGTDWIGDKSVERILEIGENLSISKLPSAEFLISPDRLTGLLKQYQHLNRESDDSVVDVDSDEVSIDEDEESALDEDDRSRWLNFFLWLGVNQCLRPVHFHDVEDRASGWLNTSDLRRPTGWVFQNVRADVWDRFVGQVRQQLAGMDRDRLEKSVPYFYRIHDLEHLGIILAAATRDTTAKLGGALYEHLALNWGILEKFSQAHVALIPRDQMPSLRGKPPRAREDEIVEAGYNFWMARLRKVSFCPTNHGPRSADKVWWPTPEVKRRFERGAQPGSYLIPVLDVSSAVLKGKSRGFAQAIGIRDELSAATFTLGDARILLDRLRDLYSVRCEANEDLHQELREDIRPGYRHLFELLSGYERVLDDGMAYIPNTNAPLSEAPLLAQDGNGRLSFLPAGHIYYIGRRDTRDRLRTGSAFWSFIIEASPPARFPLLQTCGVRELESSLTWIPSPGDISLDEEGCRQLRKELYEIGPYLLARLGTDRENEQLVQQDTRRLRQLIDHIEPVTHLGLRCELDGQHLDVNTAEREAFVQFRKDAPVQAFVVWGENPWPPNPGEAEALVTALCDVFGSRYFESFLALVQARSADARERILRRAGAPLDIDERRAILLGAEHRNPTEEVSTKSADIHEPKTAGSPDLDEQPPGETTEGTSQRGSDERSRVSLYKPGELLVYGKPITIFGHHAEITPHNNADSDPTARTRESAPGSARGYGGGMDLNALDQLGMWVALSFERHRLRRSGVTCAEIWDLTNRDEQTDAIIFDLTTPEKIDCAMKRCKSLDVALRYLHAEYDISLEWPGFDVLSLNPSMPGGISRIIELKSSGVASRTQGISWNEWKTAKANRLSEQFYLYLVGNLRSDLHGNMPFLRAIHNPFDQLRADVQEHQTLQRRVQLSVYDFKQAEELILGITGSNLGDEPREDRTTSEELINYEFIYDNKQPVSRDDL